MTAIDLASVESRTRFMNISSEMGCDQTQIYHMKPLSHNTMSPSLVAKGRIDVKNYSVPVIAKVSSVAGSKRTESGLLYEADIYRQTNRLVKRYITPHVIAAYGILRCRDLLTLVSQRFGEVIKIPGVMDAYRTYVDPDGKDKKGVVWDTKIKPHLPADGIDYRAWIDFAVRSRYFGIGDDPFRHKHDATVMYFEVASGVTLDRFLHEYITKGDQLLIILQQIVYTIVCFVDIGLVHNDMHSNNVFVDKLPTPTQFVYFINNDEFIVLTIEWFARVFDFDLSAMPEKYGTNPAVEESGDLCTYYGVCDRFNPKFDLFTLMGTVWVNTYPKSIRKVVDTVYSMAVPSFISPRRTPFLARFCHWTGVPKGKTREALDSYKMAFEKEYLEDWKAQKQTKYDYLIKIAKQFQDIIHTLDIPYQSRSDKERVQLAKANLVGINARLRRLDEETKAGPDYIPKPGFDPTRRCDPDYVPTDDEVEHPLDFLIQLAKMAGTYHELSSVTPDVLATVKGAISARRVFTRVNVDRTNVIRTVMSM